MKRRLGPACGTGGECLRMGDSDTDDGEVWLMLGCPGTTGRETEEQGDSVGPLAGTNKGWNLYTT